MYLSSRLPPEPPSSLSPFLSLSGLPSGPFYRVCSFGSDAASIIESLVSIVRGSGCKSVPKGDSCLSLVLIGGGLIEGFLIGGLDFKSSLGIIFY